VQGTPSVIDQITPIAVLVQSELVLFTTPDSEFNSLQDVVAAATANPAASALRAARRAETTTS
jgi:putative tricarboxylic transport membrane protein